MWATLLLLVPATLFAADDPPANPLRFRTAIELALQHSGVMGIAAANQLHSRKAYEEVKNHYLPQLTVGSGLGYSVGFPLTLEGSAPSVANFTSTQSLFNLSLKEFLKAAKIDWNASSFDVQDKRAEVILDASLSYAQLVNLSGRISTLLDAQKSAEKAQFVTEQRLNEGVDSKLDLTKAQLTAARIRLRIADAQGQQDVLREHLAKLTGLDARRDSARSRVHAATAADLARRQSRGTRCRKQPGGETGRAESRGCSRSRQRRAPRKPALR